MAESSNNRQPYLDSVPLYTPVPQYVYQDTQQVHQIIDYEKKRFLPGIHQSTLQAEDNSNLIVFQMSPSAFKREFDHESSRKLGSFYEYKLSDEILILKIATLEHRNAARAMHMLIVNALANMGHVTDLMVFGGVKLNVGADVKIPDEGWGPVMNSPDPIERPTVILEVGVIETEAKLQEDARIWVDPARGKANIAITIKVKRGQALLKLEKWGWDMATDRPTVIRHIEMRGEGGSIVVSGGPLLIPFQQIWRRAAARPGELDIIFDEEKLTSLAKFVWNVMKIQY